MGLVDILVIKRLYSIDLLFGKHVIINYYHIMLSIFNNFLPRSAVAWAMDKR